MLLAEPGTVAEALTIIMSEAVNIFACVTGCFAAANLFVATMVVLSAVDIETAVLEANLLLGAMVM